MAEQTDPTVPAHRPMQIGTHDAEGWRTHTIPGDVCEACSDPATGRWVPVSQCPEALAALDADEATEIVPAPTVTATTGIDGSLTLERTEPPADTTKLGREDLALGYPLFDAAQAAYEAFHGPNPTDSAPWTEFIAFGGFHEAWLRAAQAAIDVALAAVRGEPHTTPIAGGGGDVRVTCEHLQTGETQSVVIQDDCVVIVAGTAYVHGVQDYPTSGTQVWTVKGRGGRG